MSREKLNEELFDVFLTEALRQIEEEELQKSEQFFEEHREEIQIHEAANQAFEQLPESKVPSRRSLNEEFHRCLSEKKKAYTEYRQVKKEMQEYLTSKQTVEHIFGIDLEETREAKEEKYRIQE